MNNSSQTIKLIISIYPLSFIFIIIGSLLQGFANNTLDSFFVTFTFLFLGSFIIHLFCPRKIEELKTYILLYSIYVFSGGLAQFYSICFFNNPQSTTDSFTFFKHIAPSPPFMTMDQLPVFNSPLAIIIWQQIYKITWFIGLDFGPYIGIIFNAFIMGINGSITVNIARCLFGNDIDRLKRVRFFYSLCGLFLLFGSVLLRDCFTIFFNILILSSILKLLTNQKVKNLVYSIIITIISSIAMVYLRFETVYVFGIIWYMVIIIWLISNKLNNTRLLISLFLLSSMIILSPSIKNFFETVNEIKTIKSERYSELSENNSNSNSLGMKIVINQPVFIRIFTGSLMLMIFPIPLWSYFSIKYGDYHIFKGYHGFYQIFLIPYIMVGFLIIFKRYHKNQKQMAPFLFLASYFLINLFGVVLSSLEQRHLAQFMPSMLIIAAIPNLKDIKIKNTFNIFRFIWLFFVIFIHIFWLILKYF